MKDYAFGDIFDTFGLGCYRLVGKVRDASPQDSEMSVYDRRPARGAKA